MRHQYFLYHNANFMDGFRRLRWSRMCYASYPSINRMLLPERSFLHISPLIKDMRFIDGVCFPQYHIRNNPSVSQLAAFHRDEVDPASMNTRSMDP